MIFGKKLKAGELYKRLLPVISEAVESSAFAAVLFSYEIPQKYIAISLLVKGMIKSYLLRNAIIKEPKMTEGIPVASETSDNEPTLSLEDRVDAVVDYVNDLIRKNCQHPGFTKESLKPQIVMLLTKSEQEIAKEALSRLSPLQRKVLNV